MAGISVAGGKGGRRSLDSEINMIPMIDLLMVTISFLLITAVWVEYQRLEASGQAPGSATAPPCEGECKEEPKLHVETGDPTKLVLAWKQGRTVLHSSEVPHGTSGTASAHKLAFAALAEKVEQEWQVNGTHRDATDRHRDHAVVHARNDMPYSELVAVMDAIARTSRPLTVASKTASAQAFEVTLAAD